MSRYDDENSHQESKDDTASPQPSIYADAARLLSPEMERQEPGNVRTEAWEPRIKLESNNEVTTTARLPARQTLVRDTNDDDYIESILDVGEGSRVRSNWISHGRFR